MTVLPPPSLSLTAAHCCLRQVYNNRAACYKQLSNFDGTIEDSTNVLEHEPDNVKALVRR